MAASSSQGWDQCIDDNVAQGPALRAPHAVAFFGLLEPESVSHAATLGSREIIMFTLFNR